MAALAEPASVLMPAHLSADIVAGRRTIPIDRPLDTTEVVTRIDQPLGLSRKGLYLKRQRLGLE